MKRTINVGSLLKIVEGNPSEVTKNEILVIRDPEDPKKILDLQKRINGQLVSIITRP